MGGYAWVTLATTDSYSLGALVLAHSLKHVGTRHQLAVLITPGVTDPMRNKLKEVFDLVEEVNVLDSKDEANLKLLKRPELGITFTKLHCWRLTQYEKCVFLDADTLVLENCDELFERDELSAAPDVGWPDCFNSGVFVYCPSNETFSNLVQFALDKGSFDGGDQGLLNLYFSDWAHKDIRKHLPFIYNMSSTACYSYLPAFKQFGKNAKIVHFIGGTKPWLQYFDIETRTVHPSHELQHMKEVLQHWWNIFCNSVHPSLSNEMSNPSTSTGYDSFRQNVTHTSYYYLFESQSTNVADDYENVWDPWEEYLEKLAHNQSSSSPVHHESSQYDSSDHNHPNQDQYHSNQDQYHSNQDQYHSNQDQYHSNQDQYHSNQDQNHSNHDQNHPYQHYSHFNQEIHKSDTDRHEHSDTAQLIESHNTNTEFAHHYHEKHFSPPTYSQSQPSSPTVHYDPPSAPVHEPSMTEPPPHLPSNESNQCVATMVVSNETSLQSNHEDEQNNDSGFAGAFAKLTLGVARTPEQAALDDHLRRQGWEVGNIDYLGRDSFDNIWSKICETLAAAPSEPTPKPKEPSPPKPAATESSEKIEKKTEQMPQPEQPKQEVPATVEAPKAAEAAAADPVCAIQASKPTEAPVTDPVCALPLDTQTATPPKQEASEILACSISTPKSEAPTAAESAPVCPSATATPPAEALICPTSATISPEPVSATPSPAECPVCPIPSESPAAVQIPVSTALPTAGPVSSIISSMPEPPLAICSAPPPTNEPVAQSPAPASSPKSPAAAPVSQSPEPVTVPQSPTPAIVPQGPEPTPAPQSPAPASVPQSPAPSSVPQSPTPAAVQQSSAPASVPQSPAPASVPQSPEPTSVPQSPTAAAVPQSSAPASTPQTPAPALVPQSPTSAEVPQSTAPASIPQSITPASDSSIPAPDAVPQSPQPASTPQTPALASTPQTPAPASTPQSPAPASTPQSPAPASTPQSPAIASTPQSPAPASTPQSPAIASTPQSSAPVADTPVEVTPKDASKPEESSELASQTEAPKEGSAPIQTPVSEVSKDSPTEVPTAAAKPLEASHKPQDKQEKAAEQASNDNAGPTPPPRKGSGPKKSGGKGKK